MTRALVLLVALCASLGGGCKRTCDDIQSEWRDEFNGVGSGCSTARDCVSPGATTGPTGSCGLNDCRGRLVNKGEYSASPAEPLEREWSRRQCAWSMSGGETNTPPDACRARIDCIHLQCTSVCDNLDGGTTDGAPPDGMADGFGDAPPDALPADAPGG